MAKGSEVCNVQVFQKEVLQKIKHDMDMAAINCLLNIIIWDSPAETKHSKFEGFFLSPLQIDLKDNLDP